MAARKFWQSLISLGGRRKRAAGSNYTFTPACRIYLRANGAWVFPMNVRGGSAGGMGVMVGPAEMVQNDMPERALGEAVLAAISRSHFEEWDYKSPLPDSTMAPQSAGFKSYGDLERGARLLKVYCTGDRFTISAWGASKSGGYEPIPGGEQTCQNDPLLIGKAIKDLSTRCVARTAKATGKGAENVNLPPEPNAGSEDVPVSFGYKISWIAVRTSNGQDVARSIGLKDVKSCSWKQGIDQAYARSGTFITPTIEEWTIAVGTHPEVGQATFLPYMERLSHEFGEAFYFGTHRIVGYQAWGHAKEGRIVRAFGYLGEKGEFLIDVGDRIQEEIERGTGIEDIDSAPDDDTVLDLAGNWVLDPREIDLHTTAIGPGLFGIS